MNSPLARQGRVCVVGASNIDLITYVERLPSKGETLKAHSFHQGFGGKGANQAVACAKLTLEDEAGKVCMITKLGQDLFGQETLNNFQKFGIDTTHILFTDKATSGVAPAYITMEKGDNYITIVGGANDLLSEDEIETARSHIKSCDILACQLEIQPQVTLKALKVAREEGVTTVLNPAPAVSGLVDEFYQYSDIFCPNEVEAEMLSGMPVASTEQAIEVSRFFLRKGAKNVVLTLGERGCLIATADGTTTLLPCPDVGEVVDTIGAGDCFVGSMVYFLSKGESLEQACAKATHIASISVTSKGTQTSYLPRASLPAHLFTTSSSSSSLN